MSDQLALLVEGAMGEDDDAFTGAGSVITKDVEAGSLALERSEQRGIAGWARRFRERMTAKRAD